MSGETDLKKMLSTLSPSLRDGHFVFCCVSTDSEADFQDLSPIATFREAEGLTLVLQKEIADQAKLQYTAEFCCISLAVHSSLQAVGLTAAVSTALSFRGISANVIAAYYHDHIFVPSDKANQAMLALQALSQT
jgi:uncharacterized protein